MMHQLALTIGGSGGYQIKLPSQIDTLTNNAKSFGSNIIQHSIELLFVFAALFALYYFMYGGYKWMISQGDKKNVEEARTIITNTVIALIIIFLSFLIVNVIGAFFNVPLIPGS